jgi:arabinose-5-phosphate isomerase
VHADEALHGDLGMITEHDLVIAISYSGKTEEVVRSVSSVKRNNIPVIAISHSENSPLAKLSDIHLKVAVEKEAGTLNLAPSCSTTATLAVGDALALCVSKFKLFTPKDFAGSHPGGALGKKLLFSVRDVMRSGSELPLVNVRDTVSDAVREISLKGLGFCMISDDNGHVQGVFTDGDLRRALQEESSEIKDKAVNLFMTRFPKTISANNPATAALDIMEKEKIKQLIVIEDNKLVGVVYLLDMLKAKVI